MATATSNQHDRLNRDAELVSLIVCLVGAKRRGEYLRAADAHRELERRGVIVKFPRHRTTAEAAR